MPRLSCWFVRASFIYLILGVTLGSLLLGHKGFSLHPAIWRLLPAHVEFVFLGWMAQLAMGVGFWIFPRFWRSRGDERPAWLGFGLLNTGIWMVAAASIPGAPAWLSLLGRLAQVGAVFCFLVHAWPRIKPSGA
ncbi:MAG: cbb3-type cytochrome c oxidase subunit I [Anaerolineae bacterium]